MNPRHLLAVFSFALLIGAAPCIWDKDTLGDEVRGLPGAFDLVTGRFFTHVKEYYRRRIETLPKHLRENPEDLAAYDDLAVAYERLRDRDNAIAVMEQKAAALQRAKSAGRAEYTTQLYRYHANLGTFLAHSGRFDEALLQLEKAIEINPKAHFGRERFQIDLIRYVAAARKDPSLWTKHNFLTLGNYQIEKHSWSGFIVDLSFSEHILREKEREKHRWTTFDAAYTAVAGMLRFGGLEGAELYRVAGDLFAMRRDLHLAWWSYHRAIERGHPAKERLRASVASIEKHWREARKIVGGIGPIPNGPRYEAVRKESMAWREAFHRAEIEALHRGKDTSEAAVVKELVATADRAVPRGNFATSSRVPVARPGKGE